MKNKKIAVAGHLCVDITPGFLPNQKSENISDILKPGKLLNIGSATISVGGAVANTGLALKKFGSDVILLGKIADDGFGDIIKSTFREYGADQNLILADGESTSYTMALAPPGIDRIFLHHMGTNATFCSDDLDYGLIAKAGHFHFGYPPLMRRMYLDGGAELVKIFQNVKKAGLTTSLDMAAVEDGSETAAQDWKKIIRSILPYVDFFVPSIEELGYMMDQSIYHEWNVRAKGADITSVLDIRKDVAPLADTLIEWGAKCVLIKCGALGMYLRTAPPQAMARIDPQFEGWGDIRAFEKSYVPDRILSGTGAGDTSIAAFLKAAIEGFSHERCLQFAAAAGASCITEYDTLSGLKSFDELTERIDSGWPKNEYSIFY